MPNLKVASPFTLHPNKGFTLVETLIGLAIIGVIGTVIFNVLNRTFQSNAKTIVISSIKANGQNALTQIDQMVRAADSIVCIGNTTNSTITLLKTGTYQRVTFYPQTNNANGYLAIDYPIPAETPADVTIPNCGLSPTTPYKRCPNNFCQSGFTPVNQIVVTDQNTSSGVSVRAKTPSDPPNYFTKQANPGSQDSLTIDFNLGPAINSGNTFEKSIGPNNQVNFKTSIDLR